MDEDAISHLPAYTVVLQNMESGPCEACKESGIKTNKATFWCRHCWDFLCDSCGYSHLLQFPAHRLTPVCRNYAQLKKLKYERYYRRAHHHGPSYDRKVDKPPPAKPVFVSRPSGGFSDRCSWKSLSDLALFKGHDRYDYRSWNRATAQIPSATLNCNLESIGTNVASSCCFLPNGDVVVVSYDASNVRIYHSPSYRFATETVCKTNPFDLTTIRSGAWADLLLVVTAQRCYLYVYKVKQVEKTCLVPDHKTVTEKQYVGVSGIKGTDLLVVTSPGQYPPCLDIISSKDAVIIRSFEDCTSPFANIRYVSAYDSLVFLTDTDLDTVVCLNLNKTFSKERSVNDKTYFKLPTKLDGRVHRSLTGVCVHKGWIFVASQDENKIHVFSLRGKYCGELAVVNGELLGPCRMSVDNSGKMAVIQQDGRVRIMWLILPISQSSIKN